VDDVVVEVEAREDPLVDEDVGHFGDNLQLNLPLLVRLLLPEPL
jgi:hypothetical protein